MAYLRHYWNGNVVSMYEIKETVLLGRHPTCNITIDDPTISSSHAKLTLTSENCRLEDTDSTNGIRLNGKQISSAILSAGAIFAIGTHEFEYLQEIPHDLDKTLEIKKSWIPGVYFAR
ncbi:FHA domain-containing protein [Agarilytica rhodophyticola]|uniref:FHA domain-containing protein n=1 Tax=Agarilytica rhodophyticola TaxID=1737490 RepID=UPI000B345E00|nr:FHA domain-containing protein [Agarilytica rhodophyticola]